MLTNRMNEDEGQNEQEAVAVASEGNIERSVCGLATSSQKMCESPDNSSVANLQYPENSQNA